MPRLLVLLATSLLAGCGLAGETTRQTVSLDLAGLPETLVPVQVETVAMDPGAAALHAVGTYAWGKFNETDLANIRGSLEDTIEAATSGKQIDASNTLRVLVQLRRYIVASTNHSVAVLAAVDWCAARADGAALYSEGFYATDYFSFGGTLGMAKDAVTRAIVHRIAGSSLRLSTGEQPDAEWSKKVEGTYDNFEDAAATLPARMKSTGIMTFTPTPIYIPGFGPRGIPWTTAKITEAVPCEGLIAEQVVN